MEGCTAFTVVFARGDHPRINVLRGGSPVGAVSRCGDEIPERWKFEIHEWKTLHGTGGIVEGNYATRECALGRLLCLLAIKAD